MGLLFPEISWPENHRPSIWRKARDEIELETKPATARRPARPPRGGVEQSETAVSDIERHNGGEGLARLISILP
jgi:hypothetical protein